MWCGCLIIIMKFLNLTSLCLSLAILWHRQWSTATAQPGHPAGQPVQAEGQPGTRLTGACPIQQVASPIQQVASPIQQVASPLQQIVKTFQQVASPLSQGASSQKQEACSL